MSIVNFTEPAEFDLIRIDNYISQELMNPDASQNTIDGIVNTAEGTSTG